MQTCKTVSSYFELISELSDYRKFTLQIELTDKCNLSCPNCNQGMTSGNVHGKETGFMHPGLFRKIMDDMKNSRIRFFEVQPFWFGEPLLHPDFEHILSLLFLYMEKDHLFAQIDLHTNGNVMSKRIRDLLIFANIKMPVLTFSIDAATQETYDKLRPGGDLSRVNETVKDFVKHREKLGLSLPCVRVQFLLFEENRHEIKEFISSWSNFFSETSRKNPVVKACKDYFKDHDFRNNYPKLCKESSMYPDDVFDVSHPIYPHESWKLELSKVTDVFKDSIWIKRPNLLPRERQEQTNRLFNEVMSELDLRNRDHENYRVFAHPENMLPDFSLEYFGKKGICAAPFFKPVIRWDGSLHLCCNDPLGINSLGNLADHSFDELWFSEKARLFREKHLNGSLDNVDICSDCQGFDGLSIDNENIGKHYG